MTLKFIYEKYFLLNLKDYPNIGINLEINKLVLAFTIGVVIASLLVNYHRAYIHLTIKSLLRHNAFDQKSAKNLGELGINVSSVRFALSRSGQLSKMVRRVGEVHYTYEEYVEKQKLRDKKEEKIDFATALFYLDEYHLDRARHISETGTPSLIKAILFALLILAIGGCLFLLMPEILTGINSLLAP